MSGSRSYDRQGLVGMGQREVEGRVAAHRQADDMRPLDPVVPEYGDEVADGQRLAVRERVRWNVGRRIAARVEREASMATGERLHLGFPVAQVARELVDEHAPGVPVPVDAVASRTPSASA